jgi:hypothetical protein
MPYSIFTKEQAVEGFALARPAIEDLLKTPRALRNRPNGVGIHVVALVPDEFEVLHEESFGNIVLVRERGYDQYARDKARKAMRIGSSGDRTKYIAPWRNRIGDIRYPGAAYEDGYCVATSGLSRANLDTTISWIVFNLTSGMCVDDDVSMEEDPEYGAYYK